MLRMVRRVTGALLSELSLIARDGDGRIVIVSVSEAFLALLGGRKCALMAGWSVDWDGWLMCSGR